MSRFRRLLAVIVPLLLSPLLQAGSVSDGVRNLDEKTFLRYWRNGKVARYFVRPSSDEKLELVGELRTEEGREAFTATVRRKGNLVRKLKMESDAVAVTRTRNVSGGLGFMFLLLPPVLILLGSVFWMSMLIHCLWKRHPDSNDKRIWALLIIFTNLLGAFLYLFIQRGRTSTPAEEA